MTAVLEALGAILSRLATALGLLNNLQSLINALTGQVSDTALQTTLVDTEDEVTLVYAVVNDPVYGNDAILTALTAQTSTLLAAITATQQSGSPVTLPTSPPPGYGGGSSDLTADQVWEYVVPGQEFTTGGLNAFAGNYARSLGNYTLVPLQSTNYFAIAGDLWDVEGDYFQGGWPIGDPSTILPTDTVLTWLERESNLTGWFLQSNGTLYAWEIPDFENPLYFVCTLDAASFAALQAAGSAKTILVPPIWPGFDNVTFGEVQTLADGLNIPGPLDGIYVIITAVAYPVGYYPFGDIKSYTKVGGVVFVAGTQQAELAQPLGLQSNIICPKSMVQASFAVLRLQSGVEGIVYPWTRNA